MWGRLFLSAVVVVLIIVWLVAIYLMIVDPRTVLQKWQRGLWSTAHTIP
jgi:succinate dehydrogenase hydrophobic anchor subunit